MSEIVTETKDGVLTVTINRPDKKNALTQAMYGTIADALQDAEADSAVRAVLIAGVAGAFTAGNDLQDFLSNPPQGETAPVFRFLRTISDASKPIVAAVTGVAVGVGSTMLLHCDLVYAAESAKFSFPFVNLALVPEAASSLLLPRMVGYHKAAEMILLGEPFDAAAAAACGIANAVCPDEAVVATALAAARKLAAKPPGALKLSKQLMKQAKPGVPEQMAAENALFAVQVQSAEAREAMTAFFEKRPPKFS